MSTESNKASYRETTRIMYRYLSLFSTGGFALAVSLLQEGKVINTAQHVKDVAYWMLTSFFISIVINFIIILVDWFGITHLMDITSKNIEKPKKDKIKKRYLATNIVMVVILVSCLVAGVILGYKALVGIYFKS